ncbi:MAG TPA: LuxR C-terminal-related transcriptional regulator [Bacteroidia bacterium]|nr:LuxR C-terminal-related transcriptional regulator [Bacteroidia bacterium]
MSEYVEALIKKKLTVNRDIEDFSRKYFKELPYMPTVFFTLDLCTGKYAHLSDGFPSDMNNCRQLLKDIGVGYFILMKHQAEAEIYNSIYKKRFQFMTTIPLNDQTKYCYTDNYRAATDNNTYRHILQHTIIPKSDEYGMPLILSGVCIDISSYKTDNIITETVSYCDKNDNNIIVYQDRYYPDDPTLELTLREKEIINLVLKGYNNSVIAQKLNISFHTVKTHRRNIREKTCTNNVAQLMQFSKDKRFIF